MIVGLVGAGTVLGAATTASAASDDVMALQTAASIENLAVSVYTTAAGLPFIKAGNKTVAALYAGRGAQRPAHRQGPCRRGEAGHHAGGRRRVDVHEVRQ
jgi:hypothetical protein